MTVTYPIIIEQSEDGYYAECPFLQGVYTQANSQEQAIKNLKEVMQMTLQDMKDRGEALKRGSLEPSLTISSLTFAF